MLNPHVAPGVAALFQEDVNDAINVVDMESAHTSGAEQIRNPGLRGSFAHTPPKKSASGNAVEQDKGYLSCKG